MQLLGTATWHVPYVSLYRATCNAAGCVEFADARSDIPMLRDGDHLSEEGASSCDVLSNPVGGAVVRASHLFNLLLHCRRRRDSFHRDRLMPALAMQRRGDLR